MTDSLNRARLILQVALDSTDASLTDAGLLTGAGDIACAIFRAGASVDGEALGRTVLAFQHAGVAVLIADDIDMAERTNADGVHLTFVPDMLQAYGDARARLGNQIIGAEAGPGHHTAMLLGEQGADYVAFRLPEQIDDLLWWCEVIEIPSVALGEIGAEQAGELSHHGVEFISVACDAATVQAFEDAIASQEMASV